VAQFLDNSRVAENMMYTKYLIAKRTVTSIKNLFLRRLYRPIKIQRFNYEVTRLCNGRCAYCGIWKTKDVSDELSLQELEDGLKPVELFRSVEEIGITGGEPFLRKDLVDLCQLLKEICPNSSLGLVTNGLQPKLVLEKMKEIREFEPNVHIGVSIDGFGYVDSILRGNPKHCELAWETVELLKEEGFSVGVGSVVTSLNIDIMLDFKRFCQKKGVPHDVMTANFSEHFYNNVDNAEMKNLAIPKSKYSLFKKICLTGRVTSFRYYFPKYLKERRQIIPCFSGFNSFFLSSKGTVYPCIHLNQPFGNIKEEPFGNFWNDENARKIRKRIVQGLCHCYTQCEVSGWFRANIIPAVIKRLKEKMNHAK